MMMPGPPTGDFEETVARYLAGELEEAEFAGLKEALRNDPGARDRYLEGVKVDTLLREIAGATEEEAREEPRRPLAKRVVLCGMGLAASLLILFAVTSAFDFGPQISAEIAVVTEASWLGEALEEGAELRAGDGVKLASGSVEIRFGSGAVTRIHGPASFDVTSENEGFLHYGRVWSRAETPESDGFTLRTPSGTFVDRGTEFLTTAKTNGFSQMQVTSGAVDAEIEGFERQRFEKGSGVGIEPGEIPVLIRIESGEGTAAFRFPTVPPPSASDAADRASGNASVRLISSDARGRENMPHQNSGPPVLLIDGRAQSGEDDPSGSFYFPDGATGGILLDLGAAIDVSRVHTYSWHLNDERPEMRRRAVQRYTLWACGPDMPLELPASGESNGWQRVARVDTDAFFGVEEEPDRPAQQACAIHSNGPAIGKFRYLLFQVNPTPMPDGLRARHTFFGEIDVFIP